MINKEPSAKMKRVLNNLLHYEFIDKTQWNKAKNNYYLCGYFINKYQEKMHTEISINRPCNNFEDYYEIESNDDSEFY